MSNRKIPDFVLPSAVTAILIGIAFSFVGCMTDAVRSQPAIGDEFAIEGFQKAKIIGFSNSRAMVVLTNNAGHNSFHEMSFNTIQMFKEMEKND